MRTSGTPGPCCHHARAATVEFKYSRQYVLRSADLELHDRFPSDHYMIKVSVKIYLEDNDPR